MLFAFLRTHFPLIFESPGFGWLWLANLVSKLGDWMGLIALNLYVYTLTGSATALAGLLAVEAVPALLIGSVAGVVVDRFRRRHVMIISNLGAALIFALLPLATALWQIYVSSINPPPLVGSPVKGSTGLFKPSKSSSLANGLDCVGKSNAETVFEATTSGGGNSLLALLSRVMVSFFDPAERSLVPDLVGKEKVLGANAALSGVNFLALIIGPALAGFLVAGSSAAVAFWADAISFVVAILFISRIQGEIPRSRLEQKEAPGWVADLKFGIQYAFSHVALRILLITNFIAAFCGAALTTIEVVYIKDVLQGGDVGYGLLYSVAGFGAIVASANATRWSRRFTLPGLYVGSVLLTGLMFFPYANIQVLWFVIIFSGLHTIPWVLGYILVDTMLQQWVPDEVRGRIFGLVHTQRSAGQVLVAALLAPLVDWWGPAMVLNLSGFIYTLVGLYVITRLGMLRQEELKFRQMPL